MTNNHIHKPIISFNNVNLSFKGREILKNLSFNIYPGEIVSVLGPSGTGKSTILRLISGLVKPDSGEITVNAKRFGMAFQHGALFNSMTIQENIALALEETTQMNYEEINERVNEALEIVGLPNTADMYPKELSGGMQKRISIARALALHPEILLYDEPSTGLDPATAAKLEEDMLALRDKIGLTSIVVTHDVDTVKHISDRVLILDKGNIVWKGTCIEFMEADSPYPCSFRERKTLEECGINSDENK